MELSRPPSQGQLDRIGDRIREHGRILDDDLSVLRVWLRRHEVVNQEAVEVVERLGYSPAQRVKTLMTMVDKVLRQRRMRLSQMQDVAGVRVVVSGGLREQDEACRDIRAAFPQSPKMYDRRTKPSYGYRAVHIVVRYSGCLVEVQVRTVLQHRWAEVYERLADRWGRGMRYGDRPLDPNRAEIVEDVLRLADLIRHVEERESAAFEASVVRGAADGDPVHDMLLDMRARREWLRRSLEAIAREVKG